MIDFHAIFEWQFSNARTKVAGHGYRLDLGMGVNFPDVIRKARPGIYHAISHSCDIKKDLGLGYA